MALLTFGWEGFSFNHPSDWGPVALTGNREQGYARIGSPHRLVLQIRWKRLRRPTDADGFLDTYLAKLAADARRGGTTLQSVREIEDGRSLYRYAGHIYGRGALFQTDRRAFVLEASSTKDDSINGIFRDAVRSFRAGEALDRWSAYGLDFRLPAGLEVHRKEFLSGKTRLELNGKMAQVRAERWGFADQLLARHPFTDWAKAVLGDENATVTPEGAGMRLIFKGGRKAQAEALAMHQPDRNQLVLIRSDFREAQWRPAWDWLN